MSEPISEQFRITAKEWCEADAAASLLEETKSSVLSQMMLAQGDIAVNKAEMNVKASSAWVEHIVKMVDARRQANLLKVKREWLLMRHREWIAADANNRAEMRL